MNDRRIRHPAVSGAFYPDEARTLAAEVSSYIKQGRRPDLLPGPPKALIAPHAGYAYSGPIAGSAYAALSASRTRVTRVVLFGPSHRVAFRGMALSDADAFRTPLGDVPVDREACRLAATLPSVASNNLAHRDEHGLEVHLPFLQCSLESFSIIPVVVGDAAPEEVALVQAALWGGSETLMLISSDLSHYLPYAEASRLDRFTSEAIESLSPEHIGADQACGRIPMQGLLLEAGKRGLRAITLDQRNSGDTSGDRQQVVGYGAYAFFEERAA